MKINYLCFPQVLPIDISALSTVINWSNAFRHHFYLTATQFLMEMDVQDSGKLTNHYSV